MNIQTKFHGEIDIQPEQLWNFPKGIPGFEEEKEFVLLPIEGNNMFQVLQSSKTPSVAFIVTNPYTLVKDYSFDVDEPTGELLKIDKPEDVFVLGILTLKQPFETSPFTSRIRISMSSPILIVSFALRERTNILVNLLRLADSMTS